MKLPNADQAVVEPEKVRDYLLSPHHPIGKFKAVFFARLGYFQDQWETLADDLRTIGGLHDALPGQPSQFGHKFEILLSSLGPPGSQHTL